MSDRIEVDPKAIQDLLEYRDGKLIWKPRPREMFQTKRHCSIWNARYAGTVAGHCRGDGYTTVRLSCLGVDSPIRSSRLVWVIHHGRWPEEFIDHIDHDRGNDRIENLREVSNAENCKNKSLARVGRSGVFGVHFDARYGTWSARIHSDGEHINLGSFETKIEATAARKAAERLLGFHQNHGKRIAA